MTFFFRKWPQDIYRIYIPAACCVRGIQVLRFQEDGIARDSTIAEYKGVLDRSRKMPSVTLCGRFKLHLLHSYGTFFQLYDRPTDQYGMLIASRCRSFYICLCIYVSVGLYLSIYLFVECIFSNKRNTNPLRSELGNIPLQMPKPKWSSLARNTLIHCSLLLWRCWISSMQRSGYRRKSTLRCLPLTTHVRCCQSISTFLRHPYLKISCILLHQYILAFRNRLVWKRPSAIAI